ncbi:hypothetical protein P152DRAFT_208283 [Eremomyces bilateralis CBS 781.70]|uniref:Mannosyl-oligosaccharide glucosidase n=1 Tax=Eremomyces bilateralis CBS 781.70 TaxID=1392243 RepID=A0A6G1FSJ7_9PEZI|nr:uncharacterized protein P152DRAFT_208283 [Eremomyces bilateralis CBS 781.70]KAF1808757.1 hypothetical protein P152DRAFT_208283 [Eremomyces bilateralis CBS 781.70]
MVLVEGKEYLCTEETRLKEDRERTKYWKKWGPYTAERQWATVREDYSADGDAWSHFPHDDARSRAYRWGEDGIAGVCDTHSLQHIAFSFWNGKDPYLKERLFGLSNPQGNHGESIKEAHFHLDNTPTHSYMKYLYKYPQQAFPYDDVIKENARRTRNDREYNILDTGIFDEDDYWDIFIETAKEADDPDELLFRVTAYNRGSQRAPLHIIPHVWFRNTWAWGREDESKKPNIRRLSPLVAVSSHHKLGDRYIQMAPSPGIGRSGEDIQPSLIFTDNDTNYMRLYNADENKTPFVKDAFHRYIVDGETEAINPDKTGTKSASWYEFNEDGGVAPGECAVVRFRVSKRYEADYFDEELFDDIIERRREEADEFYWRISPMPMSEDLRNVQRQAFSGMLWCKQHYLFIWDQWANGDPSMPPPPPERIKVRNSGWKHIHMDDILSLPDKWEYPFFAAWDSAFHCIPLAMIDPDFAKKQLDLFTREWYMHPNGQLPAYEWNFGDVNPPVHAWALFRTFKIERKMYGREDIDCLERVFQKLLMNFTWWVNRKDFEGKNVFEGGFLGLDNIGLFNRSDPLPTGGTLEQADSTGWMAFYCLGMLNIAFELAKYRSIYEDIATKFFEHFILISEAMQYRTESESKSLWNEEDGFYYDAISWGDQHSIQMPVMSLVGLIPMFATLTLEPQLINKFPNFKKRLNWFIENKADVAERNLASMKIRGKDDRILLSLMSKERLVRTLERMLSETHFLSDHGIRSMSRHHKDRPYSMDVNGQKFEVAYLPGDSDSGLFGGNSNWRGPIWMAPNFLLIESCLRNHMFYGNSLQVECPTGSGNYMHLGHVAEELQHRLTNMFMRDETGRRAANGGNETLDYDPNWRDCVWFFEFFDGDTGRGLGASHQCGWTGLVAKMIHDTGINCRLPQTPRTPSTAAQHYFDDVFTRSLRYSAANPPTTPGGTKPSHIRRSSSSRSIGARTDWDTNGAATPHARLISNGARTPRLGDHVIDEEDEIDDEEDDDGLYFAAPQRSNSVGILDTEALKKREEADQHVHRHVSRRLERLRTAFGREDEDVSGGVGDEIEARH